MAYYEDIVHVKDQIKCNLCSVYIKDDNHSIDAHISSEFHRDLEVRRILVQNNIVIINNNFYCKICNKTMDKHMLREHLQSLYHEDNLDKIKNVVNTDGIFLKLPDDPTAEVNDNGVFINCILCDCQVTFTLDSVRQHINSDKHRRARAIAVQPLNGIFSVEGSDNDLWCKFCRVYFENYIEAIFDHVDNNKEHKKKVTKILNLIKDQSITIEKFLMDPKEYNAHCTKCNKMVACNVDNLERYIKGKSHRMS